MAKLTLSMVLNENTKVNTGVLKAAAVLPAIEKTKAKQQDILNLKDIKEENLKLVVKL